MEIIEQDESGKLGKIDESNESNEDDGEEMQTKQRAVKKVEENKPTSTRKGVRPPPLQVLDLVKMNNPIETPTSTIKDFLKIPVNSQLQFSRDNLKKVEDQLKQAFSVFYQKLRLLKSFSFLNTLAFSKIMKKYDKITSRGASKAYMKVVDSSYLGSSDDV